MSRMLAFSVIAIALAPLCALAQTATEPVAPPPPMPEVVEDLPADRGSDAKQSDAKQNEDPLARIERRLEQIEKRLERSESGAVAVEQQPQVLPEPTAAGETILPEVTSAGDNSRYRNYNGVWWYQLPNDRWVYWSNGEWVNFVATTQPPPPVYPSPAYSYVPSYGSYGYAPSYGGYYGYPRYNSSYGYYPRYGGYYGGGWGSAIGLGLSIADALSDDDHHHGYYYGHGHRRYHRHGDDDDDDDDD
jgi:hypothetical protein